VTSEAHRPTRASANDPPQANPGGLVQLVFLVVWRTESEGDWRIARGFLSAEASTDQSRRLVRSGAEVVLIAACAIPLPRCSQEFATSIRRFQSDFLKSCTPRQDFRARIRQELDA
jgi:hypothetical protein